MSIYNFKKQTEYPLTDEIKKLPFTEIEDIPNIDNAEKYNWVQVGTGKYGRNMYCTKTKIKRSQTMGEFYQGGIVD
tara:strand:- start:796 stop:1023 length:228 start_codon:yes stop_codon:yes gene_type:complete